MTTPATTPADCPFCGSANVKARAYDETIGGEPDAFCQCEDCSTTGPSGADKDEAIAAWNRRAAPRRVAVPEGYALVPLKANQQICQVMQWKLAEWPVRPFRVALVYEAAIREAMRTSKEGV